MSSDLVTSAQVKEVDSIY